MLVKVATVQCRSSDRAHLRLQQIATAMDARLGLRVALMMMMTVAVEPQVASRPGATLRPQPFPAPQRPPPQPQPVGPVTPPQRLQPQPQPVGPVTIPQRPQPLPAAPAVTVDNACLQCLCLASTDCKPTACHLSGPSQYYCGPYLISWAYWADAGKPNDNPNNPYAFEQCLTDLECAATTIRQYMAKNGRDCDRNGVIDCRDIARIHKAGPLDCQGTWVDNTPYWHTFQTCAA